MVVSWLIPFCGSPKRLDRRNVAIASVKSLGAHEMKITTHLCAAAAAVVCGFSLSPAWAADVSCNLASYKGQEGLTASQEGPALVVTWKGDRDQNVRLRLSVEGGAPTINDLSLQKGQGPWRALAQNLKPEYAVTTGLRRMSQQQLGALQERGVKITQEVLDRYRWDPFVDAPLEPNPADRRMLSAPPEGIPGTDQPGLPRKPEEIQRAEAVFAVNSCNVATEGGHLTVTYPGVTLGKFQGGLRYTIFKGTNLIRQEVVASTKENWVAYKYDAGLKGLAVTPQSAAKWRDVANNWQSYTFGDRPPHPMRIPLRTGNRLVVAEQGQAGSIVVFPPPHKFFWARNSSANMGYNWFRRDSATSYAVGIRQNDIEELHTSAVWPLYSARPGTDQLMTMFIYPSEGGAEESAKEVLAFTRGDKFAPLPGYKVMTHHFHWDVDELVLQAKSPAPILPDIEALKSAGINIASPVDSGAYGKNANAPVPPGMNLSGLVRGNFTQYERIAAAAEAARLVSDENFVLMISQEVGNSPVGGHTDLLFSHPVYWDSATPGQPFTETDPKYGKVYHIGSAQDFMKMVTAENAIINMPHPRTKASTSYPEAIKDEWYFKEDAYHGMGLRWGMGLDGSERRMCEYRCLPLLDDMANWLADHKGPLKYGLAISENRRVLPGEDIYGGSPVSYVKVGQVPPPQDTSPIINALKKGDMFITTGEVLVPHFEIRGTGNQRTFVADVQWTFPLAMVEIVWGDGKTTGRQVISTTDLPPFGSHRFEIPFDARGKKWIRFAAWDVAYEGAILQPQRLP